MNSYNETDLHTAMRRRKSIRSFSTDPVSEEIVRTIIEAATYAPTNCNQQLWNFVVIRDAGTKERIIAEAAGNTMLRRAPVVIVVSYDGWNYKEAIQGGSLAVGHMLLAATILGVGSLPMNSYGADTKIKKILALPESETICCFVLLGYPDERAKHAKPVERRPLDEVLHLERFTSHRQTPPYTYDPEQWSLADLVAHQQYYCRKTFSGKEMDLASSNERALVKLQLAALQGHIVDLAAYDGSYGGFFPVETRVTSVDLLPETVNYSRRAAELAGRHREKDSFVVYDTEKPIAPPASADAVTLLYKVERLPSSLRRDLFRQSRRIVKSDGSTIIIARSRHPLFILFLSLIRRVYGDDVRRTGIYAFFGPYRPVPRATLRRELQEAGFHTVTCESFFLFPPFFEQLYQMFIQYRKSEGSSYLHREKREDFFSRTLAWIVKKQGLRRVGVWGAVSVITARP